VTSKHEQLSPYGFDKIMIESPTRAMADIAWTLEALLDLHSYEIQEQLKNKEISEHETEQLWKNINSDALGTPLSYLHSLFENIKLKSDDKIVDIGSGFGNIGHYIGFQYPNCMFTGHEIVKERIDESIRVKNLFNCINCIYKQSNISDENVELEDSDVYFIYDSLTQSTRNIILNKLGEKVQRRPFKLIVIKGVTPIFSELMNIPWLAPVLGFEWYDPYRIVGVYQSV
jgi:hypothetical protein